MDIPQSVGAQPDQGCRSTHSYSPPRYKRFQDLRAPRSKQAPNITVWGCRASYSLTDRRHSRHHRLTTPRVADGPCLVTPGGRPRGVVTAWGWISLLLLLCVGQVLCVSPPPGPSTPRPHFTSRVAVHHPDVDPHTDQGFPVTPSPYLYGLPRYNTSSGLVSHRYGLLQPKLTPDLENGVSQNPLLVPGTARLPELSGTKQRTKSGVRTKKGRVRSGKVDSPRTLVSDMLTDLDLSDTHAPDVASETEAPVQGSFLWDPVPEASAGLTTLYLGGLFQLSGTPYASRSTQSELETTQLAIQHINRQQFIPGHRLHLIYNDTKVRYSLGPLNPQPNNVLF